jgi:hypothetical protein
VDQSTSSITSIHHRAHIVMSVYSLSNDDHHILVIDETVTLLSQHRSMRLDDYHIHVDHLYSHFECDVFYVTYNDCYCTTVLYPTVV